MVGITKQIATGLRTVSDPGFSTVIAGVVLLAIGLALTFAQHRQRQPD